MATEHQQLLHPVHVNSNQAEQIIETHLPLIKRMVRGFRRNHQSSVDELELVNTALLGLIDAINRYNPALGEDFTSYARIRIRGALLDRIRQEDRLSRSRRNFVKNLEAVTRQLESQLQRSPEHEEIAKAMGISLSKFEQLLAETEEKSLDILDLDKNIEQQLQGGKISDVLDFDGNDPLLKLLNIENSILIETTLEQLSAKQRLCIRLSFYENLPLTHIANLLEISVSRVSQIRTEALAAMKNFLQQYQ